MNWIESLKKLFSSSEGKDMLKFGMKPLPNMPEAVKADVLRVIEYSNTPAYKSYEQEAWAQAFNYLSTILKETATSSEVEQARGGLRATLDLLRVVDLAHKKQEEMQKKNAMIPGSPAR